MASADLAFDHANHVAAQFWSSTVAAITDGRIDTSDRYPPEVSYPGTWLRFHIP
jgi:hypothetical protein